MLFFCIYAVFFFCIYATFCIYAVFLHLCCFFILFVSAGWILVSFEFLVRVARLLVNYRGLLFYLVFVVIVFVSVVCTNYGSL